MPYRCCVPKCRGNYPNGPKVSLFSFPTEEKLKNKWLNGICRSYFQPSKASKVCELHFKSHEILRSTNVCDEKTGQLLSAPLLHPKLVEGAIPSQILGAPGYLSKSASKVRELPEQRRERLENEDMQKTTSNSLETCEI